MDRGYEEHLLSILKGREGWNDEYSSVSEFIHHLNEETVLEHQDYGYVFWKSNERQQQRQQRQILALLKATASSPMFSGHYILQFWGVVKVEGRHHHLSSSHHPFCVGKLKKRFYWYMKLCRDHVYVVDMEGAEEEQLCGVGRAYRSRHPVFSTGAALLLMRDEEYGLVLPLFDLHTYQCYGVLELITNSDRVEEYKFYKRQLEVANLCYSDPKKRERGKEKTHLKAHQHTEEQLTEECNLAASDAKKRERGKGKIGLKEHQRTEEQRTEDCNLAASKPKKRERGKRKTNLHLELLESRFGKKLEDVAEELGVGRSTIKRACREYGIERWPCEEKHKKNLSLFGGESGGVSQQETNAESSHHSNVQEEAEKVIIKVKHERVIVRFEFCLSLGLTKLIEEVASRLHLEMGSFKLKYLDEDDDEILLTRDDELQLCPKSQTAEGRTRMQLLAQ